jgi:hypothetical protein
MSLKQKDRRLNVHSKLVKLSKPSKVRIKVLCSQTVEAPHCKKAKATVYWLIEKTK